MRHQPLAVAANAVQLLAQALGIGAAAAHPAGCRRCHRWQWLLEQLGQPLLQVADLDRALRPVTPVQGDAFGHHPQFTHIARPRAGKQEIACSGRERHHRPAHGQVMVQQQRGIAIALAQCGQLQAQPGQAVIQVGAEPPGGRRGLITPDEVYASVIACGPVISE